MSIHPFSAHGPLHTETSDEKPFRMSELPEEEVAHLQERVYPASLGLHDATAGDNRRNRFFSGICLALPLAALLWALCYFALDGFLS
jgi:hypothetical protein